jgi:hypothetical protein
LWDRAERGGGSLCAVFDASDSLPLMSYRFDAREKEKAKRVSSQRQHLIFTFAIEPLYLTLGQ